MPLTRSPSQKLWLQRFVVQFPRLGILSKRTRIRPRIVTTKTKTLVKKKERKGDGCGDGWVAMVERRWDGFPGKIQRDILFAPSRGTQSLLLVMASSLLSVSLSTAFHFPLLVEQLFHLLFATDAEGIVFDALFFHLQRAFLRAICSAIFLLNLFICSNYISFVPYSHTRFKRESYTMKENSYDYLDAFQVTVKHSIPFNVTVAVSKSWLQPFYCRRSSWRHVFKDSATSCWKCSCCELPLWKLLTLSPK